MVSFVPLDWLVDQFYQVCCAVLSTSAIHASPDYIHAGIHVERLASMTTAAVQIATAPVRISYLCEKPKPPPVNHETAFGDLWISCG